MNVTYYYYTNDAVTVENAYIIFHLKLISQTEDQTRKSDSIGSDVYFL